MATDADDLIGILITILIATLPQFMHNRQEEGDANFLG